jgi:hypothetical protein
MRDKTGSAADVKITLMDHSFTQNLEKIWPCGLDGFHLNR